MQAGRKAKAMAQLRARIVAIENRPRLAPDPSGPRGPLADSLFAAAPGLLHEIFSPERRDAGAGLGFALALAGALIRPGRGAVLFIQLGREAQELGLPFGGGLASFGFAPETLVMVRARSMVEFLWAMEEAVCCRSVAAVIGEVGAHPRQLDFTASRRLSLRAAQTATSAFLLRYGREREASAATLRWRVLPEPSAQSPFDPRAPGEVRWRVGLEKGSGRAAHREWLLGWTEHGLVAIEHGSLPGLGYASPPPAPGPVPAALAHRLSQTA